MGSPTLLVPALHVGAGHPKQHELTGQKTELGWSPEGDPLDVVSQIFNAFDAGKMGVRAAVTAARENPLPRFLASLWLMPVSMCLIIECRHDAGVATMPVSSPRPV